mmetsp:Transcript_15189/g.43417  ORF Transcript_15189/g.43417 Transcript_15189/m.43417 type:complete len:209 (+) Transcript_15189:278-904(+)
MSAAFFARLIWTFDIHFHKSETRTGGPVCGSTGGSPSPRPRRAAPLTASLMASAKSPARIFAFCFLSTDTPRKSPKLPSRVSVSPMLGISVPCFVGVGSLMPFSSQPGSPRTHRRPSPFLSCTTASAISWKVRFLGGTSKKDVPPRAAPGAARRTRAWAASYANPAAESETLHASGEGLQLIDAPETAWRERTLHATSLSCPLTLQCM